MTASSITTAAERCSTVGFRTSSPYSQQMATYEVRYLSRNYPTNIDGVAVGLRVERDDEYFQFFLPIVSGLDLATTNAPSPLTEGWWQALAQLGAQDIGLMVTQQGAVPSEDPTHGLLVPISAKRIKDYLDGGGSLQELEDELWGGQLIASFDGP
jgi:hypothetical protein